MPTLSSALSLSMLAGAAVFAVPASLALDINTTPSTPRNSNPSSVVALAPSGPVFFDATRIGMGRELWVTDNSGTRLVRDLYPGSADGVRADKVAFGNTLLFVGNDGSTGDELWRTDGTAAGTQQVKDLWPGPQGARLTDAGLGRRFAPGLYKSKAYFAADDGEHGIELWETDGSEAGTAMLADLEPNGDSTPRNFLVVGSTLYFTATTAAHGTALYQFNGESVLLISGTEGMSPGQLTPQGTSLYFICYTAHYGNELCLFDGSVHVLDLNPAGSSSPNDLTATPAGLLLSANNGSHGTELFRVRGTNVQLFDLRAGAAGSYPAQIRLGSTLTSALTSVYFTADDGAHGNEVFRYTRCYRVNEFPFPDCDSETITLIDVNTNSDGPGESQGSNPSELITSGIELFFSATADGSTYQLFRVINNAVGSPLTSFSPSTQLNIRSLTPTGNGLYFVADDGIHGREVFRYVSGTVTLFDLNPSTGSYPDSLALANHTLYLAADNGSIGREPFVVGASGPEVLFNVNPELSDASPRELTDVDGRFYFTAFDGSARRLYRWSFGVSEVTIPSAASDPNARRLTPLGSTLYFFAADADGVGLFRDDGSGASRVVSVGAASNLELLTPLADNDIYFKRTAADGDKLVHWNGGTLSVLSVTAPTEVVRMGAGVYVASDVMHYCQGENVTPVTGLDSAPAPIGLTAGEDALFFQATSTGYGQELWKIGASAPTSAQRMTDIAPGSGDSYPIALTPVGNLLYFSAENAGQAALYALSGTTVTPLGVTNPDTPLRVGNKLFVRGEDAAGGYELFIVDGLSATLVEDIYPGSVGSLPGLLGAVGGVAYFTANDGTHGNELWRSDGTAAGTYLVKDLLPGRSGANPWPALAWSELGVLFFAASDGAGGVELWQTDGTDAGTQRVLDVAPGPLSSAIQALARSGNDVFFVANDGSSGLELWRVAPQADVSVSIAPSGSPAPLGGNIAWRVTVKNKGPGEARAMTLNASTSFIVSVTPMAGACSVAVDGDSPSDGSIVCDLGTLAPSAELTVLITAHASNLGSITADATITSTTLDPTPSDHTANASADIAPAADLSLTGMTEAASAHIGEHVTFVYTVSNTGPSATVATRLTSGGGIVVSATPSQGNCLIGERGAACDLGAVGAQGTAVVTIVARDDVGGTFSHTAVANADEIDVNTNNNVATASVELTPDLTTALERSRISGGCKCNSAPSPQELSLWLVLAFVLFLRRLSARRVNTFAAAHAQHLRRRRGRVV